MAHITTDTTANPTQGLFSGLFSWLTHIAETNARVQEVERLQSLSDAELAKKGLKREDIARHVFRDILYI